MNASVLFLKAGGWVEDTPARLNRLLDDQEVRIATIFRTAIADLKNEIDLDELADLIEQGRIAAALDRLEHAAVRLAAASNTAFVTAGQSAAEWMTTAGVGRIVFDQVNLNAVAAMQQNRLELVREFTAEQRRAASTAMTSGVRDGLNPRAQARNFRDAIGLTTNQWGHVASYRDALGRIGVDPAAAQDVLGRALRDKRSDSRIIRASRDGIKLSESEIDKKVEVYTRRYVKHRAEVIGRTEALRAVHQGNEEAYRQAIASGVLDEDRLERTWRTRIDGRERRTHQLLNGQVRGWGETWSSGGGELRYPGDPLAPAAETIQCRCAILTRIRQL